MHITASIRNVFFFFFANVNIWSKWMIIKNPVLLEIWLKRSLVSNASESCLLFHAKAHRARSCSLSVCRAWICIVILPYNVEVLFWHWGVVCDVCPQTADLYTVIIQFVLQKCQYLCQAELTSLPGKELAQTFCCSCSVGTNVVKIT